MIYEYNLPKHSGQMTPEDVAAIKGCLLNGAWCVDVYAAFSGLYSLEMIEKIRKELVDNGRLAG